MSIDYTVASLPALAFGDKPPMTMERFLAMAEECGETALPEKWTALDTVIRNAVVEARGGAERFRRPAGLCSIYWRNRTIACFQEKDVMKREELLDRVRWDAAGELTDPSSPLGRGALATYRIRLGIAIRRGRISKDMGNEAFDRLTRETKR